VLIDNLSGDCHQLDACLALLPARFVFSGFPLPLPFFIQADHPTQLN
jgi:hypothetical protein